MSVVEKLFGGYLFEHFGFTIFTEKVFDDKFLEFFVIIEEG